VNTDRASRGWQVENFEVMRTARRVRLEGRRNPEVATRNGRGIINLTIEPLGTSTYFPS